MRRAPHANFNMAARRNLQCLSDLVTAITRLSRENSEEQSEVSQNESVTDTIRDLFPSVNGQTSQSTSSSSRAQTPDNSQPSNLTQEDVVERPKTNNQTPDRRFVQQFENFVTNNSGKKRTKFIKKPTGSKKPKRGDQRTVLFSKMLSFYLTQSSKKSPEEQQERLCIRMGLQLPLNFTHL